MTSWFGDELQRNECRRWKLDEVIQFLVTDHKDASERVDGDFLAVGTDIRRIGIEHFGFIASYEGVVQSGAVFRIVFSQFLQYWTQRGALDPVKHRIRARKYLVIRGLPNIGTETVFQQHVG